MQSLNQCLGMEAEAVLPLSERKRSVTMSSATSAGTWFELILCDTKKEMIEAWKRHWAPSPHIPVDYHEGPFQESRLKFDCIVSPANSFGLMDGGVDLYISQYFGGVQTFVPRVQKALLDEFCGQQPVGTSFIIPTGRDEGCRFLAHTPTMRLPELVAGTDIVYRAMWSMLLAVRNHNRRSSPEDEIISVLCFGLATGCGCFPLDDAAKQMALAYKHFVTNPADTDTDPTSTAPASRNFLISWQYALGTANEVQETVNETLA